MHLERTTQGRRFILLAGAARSGTTWLGNILNSSPRSVYSHEPLLRFPDDDLGPLLKKIKETGQLSAGERELVLKHWSRAYFAVRRPPFFGKHYSRCPARLIWASWLAVNATRRGYRLFERLFTPPCDADFDLAVKQGGLTVHGQRFVSALAPDALIVIMRHPCSVVASIRRGQRLGLMPLSRREHWLRDLFPQAETLGYERRQIEEMGEAEFGALCWLLENTAYRQLLDEHPNARLVIYDELCADPMAVTESLYAALGWEVSAQTRRFVHDTGEGSSKRVQSLMTASHPYFSVYRAPRTDGDANWPELAEHEIKQILALTAPLLDHYWQTSAQAPVLS